MDQTVQAIKHNLNICETNILKNNKGLVIFYLCMSLFAMIWVSKVESNNDEMMLQKNSYILSDNL